MRQNKLSVFSGPNSVLDFLNPDNNPPTPLVQIPGELNPFASEGVIIYAKLMNFTPLGNVKHLPALSMLKSIKKSKPHTIIENSSGNTVFSMAVTGRLLGVPTTKAIVSNEVSPGKLQLLRLMGVEPIINSEPICPDPDDKTSGIYKAKLLGRQKGWVNPGQYDNVENPKSHFRWTGPQIWSQTRGKLDVFCTGLGTTGTMVGAGGYLKKKNPKIKNIAVVRTPNNPIPGVRTRKLVRQVAFPWEKIVDAVEEVGTEDSFRQSLTLCRHGLMVGPSSGFALQGLISYLRSIGSARKNLVCVFVCCDSPLPYLNEYFQYLEESDFPAVVNQDLLISQPPIPKTREVDPSAAFGQMYRTTVHPFAIRRNTTILDVRTKEEYQDAHLPGSTNIDHKLCLSGISQLSQKFQRQKVFVICRSGARSGLVTNALQDEGVEAYNIKGGMILWSQLNLPRILLPKCTV